MKKNLLIALALPAMFAACSQEDVLNENFQQNQLLGEVAGDIKFILEEGVNSRMAWGTSGNPVWNANDAFSLFWVGPTNSNTTMTKGTTEVYTSATNALYQRANETSPFESQNVVYIGNHIVVYPANKTHFENKEIVVEVGEEQDASVDLGLRSVYVSDLLTIKRPTSTREEGVMYAGYNEPVIANVAALSTNMVLNLNFALTANMQNVTIKKVELSATNNVFATKGYLKKDANNHIALHATSPCLTNKMVLTMPEGTTVTKSNPQYVAQLSLLPQSVPANTEFTIDVYTNYGKVTINTAKMVTNNSGKYQIEAGVGYNETVAETIDDETKLSFKNEFDDAAERKDLEGTANDESSYGFRFTRNVAVDMSKASITNMEIANSTELIAAYETYDLLEKNTVENFKLVGQKENAASTNKTFELTPAALAKIKANNKVTLQIAATDTLELSGAFTAVPELSEIYTTTIGSHSDVTLALGAGTEWALDVKNAKIFNSWKEISVEGELTINQSAATATDEQALAKEIKNLGNVTFIGNVTMPVVYTQLPSGNTEIGAESYVTLTTANNTISGTVEVDGKLVNKGTTTLNADANLAVAGSLMNVTGYSLTNLGTVTLEGTGSAIVTQNGDGTANGSGSIVLANRKSQVNVTGANKGYIKWTCDVEEFEDEEDDAFNYLILNNNIKFEKENYTAATDKVKYIEVAGDKVTVNGTTSLTLTTVTVNAGKTMVVPVGFVITTANTVLNGDIEVYGNYTSTDEEGTGNIFYL